MSSNHVLELVDEAFAGLCILVMVPAYLLSGFWIVDVLMLVRARIERRRAPGSSERV